MLRAGTGHESGRVTNVELFFDLVFVFAITQLSHSLLRHLTLLGAVQAALLFSAVWWVWIYTAWVTNWLDPDRLPVRVLLFVLMFAGLLLSVSLPQAFAGRGLVFAGAYVAIQLGRAGFMLWALAAADRGNFRNFQRILCWSLAAGLFWIAGALAEPTPRLLLWGLAVLVDCAAPALGFRVPGLGRSLTTDWNVRGSHMAERCALFIIIVLGESLLVTGATFEALEWSPLTLAVFALAFIGSVATWWIYFNAGADRGSRHIAQSGDPGRLARFGYTYMHMPIVAGVLLGAVADELVLVHPTGHAALPVLLAVLGGPALYLLGNALFKREFTGHLPLSHLVGLGLLAVVAVLSGDAQPVAIYAAATLCLLVVAVWETISLRPQPR